MWLQAPKLPTSPPSSLFHSRYCHQLPWRNIATCRFWYIQVCVGFTLARTNSVQCRAAMFVEIIICFAGRNFFCHPDTSLVIDGILDCYTLSTDPVQLSALQFNFKTELAWEMDLKTLQQHKLRHTPIKLQVGL